MTIKKLPTVTVKTVCLCVINGTSIQSTQSTDANVSYNQHFFLPTD